jgi:hypothetical protein
MHLSVRVRLLFLFLSLLLVQACKHPLAIQGEGDIVERLGAVRGCTLEEFNAGASRCADNEVTDSGYRVSYQAIPRPGYRFARWEGTGCATLTDEGYCEYDVAQVWVDFTNLTWPGLAMPPTTAVFLTDAEYQFEQTIAKTIIGERCANCHIEGGIASVTPLIFQPGVGDTDVYANNYQVFTNYLQSDPDAPERVLAKVRGVSHGGGVQVPATSDEFQDLSSFINDVANCSDCGGGSAGDFWEDIVLASPEATLRRAALILAGRLPTSAELEAVANASDEQLRQAILDLMQGDGFHQFLLNGANDRLLTDAFLNEAAGVDLRPATPNHPQYPELPGREYEATLDGSAEAMDDWVEWYQGAFYGMARSPLKLIAYVAENDLPYTEILTADYAMQNPQLADVYRSGVTFQSSDHREFRPGPNRGQILRDNQLNSETIPGSGLFKVLTHSGFVDYPIAGLLNSPAFLSRYPTTETNRNRARSRWTYYHFLGLDIEKSASRTTDPEALADRNNPTLNNPACIPCHELMDPVAGAFQDYGIDSYFLESWGGMDSLPEQYKTPEIATDLPGQIVEIDNPPETVQAFSVTVDNIAAGEWYIAVQFKNPASLPDENLPRAVGFESVTLRLNGEQIFSSNALDLLGIPGAQESQATDYTGLLALFSQNAFFSFPVDIPESGNLTIELAATGNTLSDGIPPRVSVTIDRSGAGSPYVEGDKWFRDMRKPGFASQEPADGTDAMRWLAEQMAADPRFATATVRFWWPALMKTEALTAPAATEDRYYAEQLRAFEEQAADIESMARRFRDGYLLKQLLADMIISPWFRASRANTEIDDSRRAELANLGMGALLTPEELNAKVYSATGFHWGQGALNPGLWGLDELDYWSELSQRMRVLYGGIDSFAASKRARQLNSLMANIAERQANQMACHSVVIDFAKTPQNRRLFGGIDKYMTPRTEFSGQHTNSGNGYGQRRSYKTVGRAAPGDKDLVIQFDNPMYSSELQLSSNIMLDRLEIRDSRGALVLELELEDALSLPGAGISEDQWGETGTIGWNEETQQEDHVLLWGGRFNVPVTLPGDDEYEVTVVAWALHVNTLKIPRFSVSLNSTDSYNSQGAEQIQAQLQQLHLQLLGEDLPLASSELAHSYELLVALWEHRVSRGFTNAQNWPEEDCYFPREFWGTPAEGDDKIDPASMLGTWGDMLVYFLTDYRFLHE